MHAPLMVWDNTPGDPVPESTRRSPAGVTRRVLCLPGSPNRQLGWIALQGYRMSVPFASLSNF